MTLTNERLGYNPCVATRGHDTVLLVCEAHQVAYALAPCLGARHTARFSCYQTQHKSMEVFVRRSDLAGP